MEIIMSKYDYLTIDQIRSALDHMEANYSAAMDCGAYGLANAFLDKITGLADELAHRFDHYTTAADVRFFESNVDV